MYDFYGRTDQPLKAATPLGYHNSTSRWQTVSSIWTLENYYPVIPMVTYSVIVIFYIKNSGSLCPT